MISERKKKKSAEVCEAVGSWLRAEVCEAVGSF
jgi:hypothetical protein